MNKYEWPIAVRELEKAAKSSIFLDERASRELQEARQVFWDFWDEFESLNRSYRALADKLRTYRLAEDAAEAAISGYEQFLLAREATLAAPDPRC